LGLPNHFASHHVRVERHALVLPRPNLNLTD
jgi:hypothetical protein